MAPLIGSLLSDKEFGDNMILFARGADGIIEFIKRTTSSATCKYYNTGHVKGRMKSIILTTRMASLGRLFAPHRHEVNLLLISLSKSFFITNIIMT